MPSQEAGAQIPLQAIATINKRLRYLLGFFVPFTTIAVDRGGSFFRNPLKASETQQKRHEVLTGEHHEPTLYFCLCVPGVHQHGTCSRR